MTDTLTASQIEESGLFAEEFTEEQAAFTRNLLVVVEQLTGDRTTPGSGGENEYTKCIHDAVKLMHGREAARMLVPPADRDAFDQAANEEAGPSSGEGTVADPGMAMMSLDRCSPAQLRSRLHRLFASGRCSKKQFIKMSCAPASDVRVLLNSNEPLSIGTFGDAGELEEMLARKTVDRLFRRK